MKYSSFIFEEAFVRAALSDGDCQEVQGDIGYGHSVQVSETGGPGWGWMLGGFVDGIGVWRWSLFPG